MDNYMIQFTTSIPNQNACNISDMDGLANNSDYILIDLNMQLTSCNRISFQSSCTVMQCMFTFNWYNW